MNKKQAAAYLKVSERAIERYAAKGKLTVKYVQGKTRPVANFDQAELDQVKDEMQNPSEPTRPAIAHAQQETPGAQALAVLNQGRGVAEFMDMLAAHVGATARHNTPLADKHMLSLPEAAELSGVSVEQLRAAVKADRLRAVKGIGGGYGKVKRADLDKFISKL